MLYFLVKYLHLLGAIMVRGSREPLASIPTPTVIHGGTLYFKSNAALTVLSKRCGRGCQNRIAAVLR